MRDDFPDTIRLSGAHKKTPVKRPFKTNEKHYTMNKDVLNHYMYLNSYQL